jgi:hypothetical protein
MSSCRAVYLIHSNDALTSSSIIHTFRHTPTPQAQLEDQRQYVENVLPHHYLFMGMALAGFELVTFEHDLDTVCQDKVTNRKFIPRGINKAKCIYNDWPKYYHAVFRKSPKNVLVLA